MCTCAADDLDEGEGLVEPPHHAVGHRCRRGRPLVRRDRRSAQQPLGSCLPRQPPVRQEACIVSVRFKLLTSTATPFHAVIARSRV